MGLFDFLFGKTITLEHEFFGTMLFIEFKKEPQKNYFECRRTFAPSAALIEIGIAADSTGPTAIQIEFFKSIETNYPAITKSIVPLIEDEFRNWKEDFRIYNFEKEFEAVYLAIPRCDTQPIQWEIAFESEHDRNHTFTILMSDFEAKEIHIDG